MTQVTRGKQTCSDKEEIQDASPNGVLVPLKTTLETTARDSFISVYVTSVPVKQASGTLE
jgi:tRNA-specific adenosine deaminase 3